MNLIPELREAFVAGLIDGTLNPDNVPGGAQVLVFYDDMLRGDQVELRWMTSLPNGSYVDMQPVQGDGQPLTFSVPYYVLDAGRGLDARLDYSATRNGAARQSYVRVIPIRSTVVPLPPPTIATVKDPQNREIAQGGVTTATTVTLAGEAAVEQQVQVFDGAVSKGIVQTDASGGWVHAVPGLAIGAHSFTARGLYGSNPQSLPRALTVTSEVTPTITSARDPQGNQIANGGYTQASRVTLAGRASANQMVELFEGSTLRGSTWCDQAGNWEYTRWDMLEGNYVFTARASYGAGHSSSAWRVTRVSALTIDTSVLTLDGIHLHIDHIPEWRRVGYAANVAVTRSARGGVGPYNYQSSNQALATVDQTGRVVSQGNGTAIITVRDALGQTATYPVACSNNYDLYVSEATTAFTFQQALNWISGSAANNPIPHKSTPLGLAMEGDVTYNLVSNSNTRHLFHTETISPGSNSTNMYNDLGPEGGSRFTVVGPMGLDTPGRAFCYRVR